MVGKNKSDKCYNPGRGYFKTEKKLYCKNHMEVYYICVIRSKKAEIQILRPGK